MNYPSINNKYGIIIARAYLKGDKYFIMEKYQDVNFSVSGTINGQLKTIDYEFKKGKGSVCCDDVVAMFKLKTATESIVPIGPVCEHSKRDIHFIFFVQN